MEGDKDRRKRLLILRRVYSKIEVWKALIESGDASDTLEVGSDTYNFYDLMSALNILPKRQRQAIELNVLQQRTEASAAKVMMTRGTTVQQYRDISLGKILDYLDHQDKHSKH